MHFKYRLCAFASIMTMATVLGSVPAVAERSTDDTATKAGAPLSRRPTSRRQRERSRQRRDRRHRPEARGKRPGRADLDRGLHRRALERTTSSPSRASARSRRTSGAKGAQSSYLRLAVRGIGAASNTTVEPSVAIFLDGAYVPRGGASSARCSTWRASKCCAARRAPCSAVTPASARFRSTRRPSSAFSGGVPARSATATVTRHPATSTCPSATKWRSASPDRAMVQGLLAQALDDKQVGGTDERSCAAASAPKRARRRNVRADYAD